jgi:magnesium-transporting ATPase (P-type)
MPSTRAGADSMMLKRINPNTSPDLLARVRDNLHFFATKGLRTLVIGTRTIPPDVYADWSRRYDEAQGQVANDSSAEEKVRCSPQMTFCRLMDQQNSFVHAKTASV